MKNLISFPILFILLAQVFSIFGKSLVTFYGARQVSSIRVRRDFGEAVMGAAAMAADVIQQGAAFKDKGASGIG